MLLSTTDSQITSEIVIDPSQKKTPCDGLTACSVISVEAHSQEGSYFVLLVYEKAPSERFYRFSQRQGNILKISFASSMLPWLHGTPFPKNYMIPQSLC